MLSTGNHGELIIDGWLASSDENASPVKSVVPATSNRTRLRMRGQPPREPYAHGVHRNEDENPHKADE